MTTIIELEVAGSLFKFDPALEPNEQEWRCIYGLPLLQPRLQAIPSWNSQWQTDVTPIKQLDALLEIFCSGETLTFDWRFKPLTHLGDGIWELKTPDLRLFGWFYEKDCFIVGAIDTAFNVKSYNLYAGHCGMVAHHRSQLDLDEPKFISGENPTDVVSNFNFP